MRIQIRDSEAWGIYLCREYCHLEDDSTIKATIEYSEQDWPSNERGILYCHLTEAEGTLTRKMRDSLTPYLLLS